MRLLSLKTTFIFSFFLLIGLMTNTAQVRAETDFESWLQGLRKQALSQGIRPETLDKALAGVKPIARVIELDQHQPEFTLTFWKYLNGAINDKRIKRGRALLKKHSKLLKKIEKKYGVPPRFLVSFWGLESNFGDFTGSFSTVGALATLAYDKRRGAFFRTQLLALLSLIDAGDIPSDIKSSWAGAMGNHQFIPTTYKSYAVDYDGDGKRDLWNSLPDIFASASNFLKASGWKSNRNWGREVRLPKDFNLELSGLGAKRKLVEWNALGVRRMDGRTLPAVDINASVVLPAGYQGPAFLVYNNFRSTLKWNRSIFYAIAVGHLADRLAGAGPLKTPKPKQEIALSRKDIMDLQSLLNAKGFNAGGADGILGSKTRNAVKAFQKSVRLPADGFASFGLLERLRGTDG